jgi:hypothetical protein
VGRNALRRDNTDPSHHRQIHKTVVTVMNDMFRRAISY